MTTLTDNFYKQLIANGPPYTLDYSNNFKTAYVLANNQDKELLIADEVTYHYSQYSKDIMACIINPSELITIAAIKKNSKYFHQINNPTNNQLVTYLSMNPEEIYKYKNLAEDDINKIILNNPSSIEYINITDQVVPQIIEALIGKKIRKNICTSRWLLLAMKESRRQSVFDKVELFDEHNFDIKYDTEKILLKITNWSDDLCEKVLESELDKYLYMLPEKYKTIDRINLIVNKYPQTINKYDLKLLTRETLEFCVKRDYNTIKHIPLELQDSELVLLFLKTHKYIDISDFELEKLNPDQVEEFITNRPSVAKLVNEWTLEIVHKFFEINHEIFRYIPDNYKTEEFCLKGIKALPKNLIYVPSVNKKLLDEAVYWDKIYYARKSKETRWNFLNEASENILIDIIKLNPNMFKFLRRDKQTDAIIKALLEVNPKCIDLVFDKEKYFG